MVKNLYTHNNILYHVGTWVLIGGCGFWKMSKLTPSEKRDLVKLIVEAGLEEELMEWLKQQGYTYVFGRLDNIPDELIEAFVREKKLDDMGEDEYRIYYELKDVEPETKRNIIPSRKPRKPFHTQSVF